MSGRSIVQRSRTTIVACASLAAAVVPWHSVASMAAQQPASSAVHAAPRGIGQAHWADFDGDGYADLAAGAPRANVAGKQEAGVVHVLYSQDDGDGISSAGDQVWHQDVAGILDEAEAGDRFGFSLAAGDYDIDGFGDLAIGIPGEDQPTEANVGAVAVLFGGAGGLSARDQFYVPNFFADEDETDAGWALVALDFISGNTSGSDGRADLAIGAPGWGEGQGSIAYVSGARLTPEIGTGLAGTLSFVADEPGARNGMTLATGDFNNVATDDLVIGAPLADIDVGPSTATDAGKVRVYYDLGSGGAEVLDQQVAGGVPANGERFGAALAAENFGALYHQLWVGVPFEDHSGAVDAGSIDRYLPAANGSGILEASLTEFRMDHFEGVAKPGDEFGSAIVMGEFGNGTLRDIAVGLPGRDLSGVNSAGAVAVEYLDVESTHVLLRQGANGLAGQPEAGDGFGSVLFAAEFSADPGPATYIDLAIGVPLEDIDSKPNAGAVQVIHGDPDFGLRPFDDRVWTVDSPGVSRKAAANDRFGAAVR